MLSTGEMPCTPFDLNRAKLMANIPTLSRSAMLVTKYQFGSWMSGAVRKACLIYVNIDTASTGRVPNAQV
jgi:hypothetical protein